MTARRSLLLFPSILLSACSGVANLNNSRMQANEMSALAQLRTLHAAETQYYSMKGRFAAQLSDLGPQGADLIPADLTAGAKAGYRFQLAAQPSGFTATAAPETLGGTGRRFFFTDQSMVIRASDGPQPATADSPEYKP